MKHIFVLSFFFAGMLSVKAADETPALVPVEGLGLRVAPGFRVTLYADHTIANDIYSMTLDAKGRVVVSSQGWIKTLIDKDGDGKPDEALQFAATGSGSMGMCFDGNDLYSCNDQNFCLFRDKDGDGKADGPPEKITALAHGEHGEHGIRKGPDGYWYVMAGNDGNIGTRHVTLPTSPVKNPQTGAVARFTPDLKKSEVIAHGLRNAYRFDFNPDGELFTYDSDCERDYFLPWYTPTRMYHLAYGMNHGWRLNGYMRSFARNDFFADNVDMLWPVGRGSPTGVVCYRHTQFPAHYHGGVFALDWTFGKVYFFALQPDGATYKTKLEVFLEPTGSEGFAPTDAAVAPDGSLFISIGGRRTRGGIYRIEYTGAAAEGPVSALRDKSGALAAVLNAQQPLDAWSRAKWVPMAKLLGAKPFEEALVEKGADTAERVRALEVLTEMFGGLRADVAAAAAKLSEPAVRARVAWSLGRIPCEGALTLLLPLAEDPDSRVRCRALEALADQFHEADAERVKPALAAAFASSDKRIRLAAARLGVLIPNTAWKNFPPQLELALPQVRLSAALATLWRDAESSSAVIDRLIPLIITTTDPDLRQQAVRLMVLALGDSNLAKPALEVYSNYALSPSPLLTQRGAEIAKEIRAIFPTGDARLDSEVARLLGMLDDSDPATVAKVAAFITDKSSPTWDVHYLIVLSRLQGAYPTGMSAKIANAILSLGKKLVGQEQRTKQVWGARLGEVVGVFLKREPGLAAELIKHPDFPNAGHVSLLAAFKPEERRAAAERFMAAVKEDKKFAWSEPLIELLSMLPSEDFFPVLREQWPNFGLRDAILQRLGVKPDEADREKFLFGVESANSQVLKLSLQALENLPADNTPKHLLPLMRLLRRLINEDDQAALRKQVLELIKRSEAFKIKWDEDEGADLAARKKAYLRIFESFSKKFEALADDLNSTGDEDPAAWKAIIKDVPWDKGEASRGEVTFRARGCQTCHAVQGALGPNLAGAASRFSREDLFDAVIYPSRDIAPPYRTTTFKMKDGQVHTGIVAFESADGYIIQTGATTTVRVNTPDVASMRPGTMSLMPNGLLKGLQPAEIADLYSYLRSLGK